MQLDIRPIHYMGMDCFTDSLVNVAAWLKREYALAFSDSWSFDFKPVDPDSPDLLGNRIARGKDSIIDIIHALCGIGFAFPNTENSQEILAIIRSQLAKGLPTIIDIDSFWCPWHNEYQKLHSPHFCMAMGIDDENNIFCADPILTPRINILHRSQSMNGCSKCVTFTIAEPKEEVDYGIFFEDAVKRLFQIDMFNKIRAFADEFENSLNYAEEFKNFKISAFYVPMHRRISYISGGRVLFSIFSNYIAERTNRSELRNVRNELKKVTFKWDMVKGLLTKCYYDQFDRKTQYKIADIIRKIADEEEAIAISLLQSQSSQYDSREDAADTCIESNKAGMPDREIVCVDLKEYFNNNGFGTSVSMDCKANLTGLGEYFLAEGLPSGKVWDLGGMCFAFPEICDGQNDNISCRQQTIEIPKGIYRSIMLLGSAEWGNFCDNVLLHYEGNKTEAMQIVFTDWVSEPALGERAVWKGSIIKKTKNDAEILRFLQARIFAREYILPEEGSIESITLPHCPNMHIIAISLC